MSNVLLVEDNRDLADSLMIALELEGHQVETEGDGAAGLLHAAERPPNVVVLDVDLPKLDGVALARGLRQMHGDAIHLIAYSGRLDDEVLVEQLEDAGVDDAILKPAPLPVLLAAVRRLAA